MAGSKTTRNFFPFYVEEKVGTTTTAIKYYTFNGMAIAVNRGGTLSYLHTAHLSSNSVSTNASGGETARRTYYAYGKERPGGTGTLPTDRTYTGQEQDTTGLMFYHARFYDPALGTFISPDTMVPQPGVVADYNRFAYVRSNPLKYIDPNGHRPDDGCETESCGSITDLWVLANGAYSLIDPQWEDEPDEIDAIAVGVGADSDQMMLGPVGFALTGGVEVVAHKNGDLALFIYGGFGQTVGEGANAKGYVGRVRNLPNIDSYEGVFEVTSVTASAGLIGATGGRFSALPDEDGAYGDFYGWAPGANLSISQSEVYYTAPWVNYNFKTNELSFPQFTKIGNVIHSVVR